MRKIVLIYGAIAGVIVSTFMAITMLNSKGCEMSDANLYKGYASMAVAFSLIFFAVKRFRDDEGSKGLTFGKAFLLGLGVAFITSTLYVTTWMFIYQLYMPDFMAQFAAKAIEKAKAAHMSAKELKAKIDEMNGYVEMYKNPVMVFLFTYMEIMPLGIVLSVIAALIFKRKPTANVAE